MSNNPIIMEDFFSPGFKAKPAVFMGSQTSHFIKGIAEEQAWEGFYLGAARPSDVVIVRNMDEDYITYWKKLMGNHHIINIKDDNPGEHLTDVILQNEEIIEDIKKAVSRESRLMVFFPTEKEAELATKLGLPMHGNHIISNTFGVKSGIRTLAQKAKIPMPPGYICKTEKEVGDAIQSLRQNFSSVVLKHDDSFSGYYSKRLEDEALDHYHSALKEICNGEFREGKDIVVVEGWITSKASLCMHIEILEGQEPILCAGWQQVIAEDGISYMGAGPLFISDKALESFIRYSKALAFELKKEGAVGSFGPDFLVTADDETRIEPDSAVLIELNARVPYTAVPLEIIKEVR
jgi:hypothetical protein